MENRESEEFNRNLDNYVAYLLFLQKKLNKFFEAQNPYVFCKKGCTHCCKNDEFLFSEVEFNYLLYGSLSLDKEVQDKIEKKIAQTFEDQKNSKGEKFKYECPFLINEECVLYNYRGIKCRTRGLISTQLNKEIKIPKCANLGLNYSNVVDFENNEISQEKYLALNEDTPPLSYNTSYDFLCSDTIEKAFDFRFGEIKPLIDWFKQD